MGGISQLHWQALASVTSPVSILYSRYKEHATGSERARQKLTHDADCVQREPYWLSADGPAPLQSGLLAREKGRSVR